MELDKLCRGCFREQDRPGVCPFCGFDEAAYERERPAEILPAGTVLQGKYLLGRSLGKGGFGITYLGWHIHLKNRVAIKEMFPSGIAVRDTRGADSPGNLRVRLLGAEGEADYEKASERFLREARILAGARLPGVVWIYDCFRENNTTYLVMEYIPGDTLLAFLGKRGGKLPEEEAKELLYPVISSLKSLHEKKIIHRDISPDNLLLDEKGKPVLIDFGAARSGDYQNQRNASVRVILKPGYAPIEQYDSNGSQGPWTDVYGISATLFRMLTGQTPQNSLTRVMEDPEGEGIARALKENNVSAGTAKAIQKGMESLYTRRFQSMDELKEALYDRGDEESAEEMQKDGEKNPPPKEEPAIETVKEKGDGESDGGKERTGEALGGEGRKQSEAIRADESEPEVRPAVRLLLAVLIFLLLFIAWLQLQ